MWELFPPYNIILDCSEQLPGIILWGGGGRFPFLQINLFSHKTNLDIISQTFILIESNTDFMIHTIVKC